VAILTWQTFTLGVLSAVAWPVTVLVVLWSSRNLLTALGARIIRDLNAGRPVKIGGAGFNLELERHDVEGTWYDMAIPDINVIIERRDPDADQGE
jgi:hypothetical protein